jgi:diaminohydroxyphosphoribosylaminopyrimidine deaminase/5-amino-6-(5-phosphoribosylamino)uracil reductase
MSPPFDSFDYRMMARALALAARGRYSAHPNPRVGCVLVQSGEVIAEGWHRLTGEPHAEVLAIRAAGESARGATAYVTLEPCSHHGRTPPCTDALVEAGVARVICAVRDPNPRVAGSGFERLRHARIDVVCGLMQDEAQRLNAGFFARMTTGRPRVTVKVAASLDGRVALPNGASHWITGEPARRDVHGLRAESGAILTGVGTVLKDDPRLDARLEGTPTLGRQPLRVVLDSALRTPPDARMFGVPGRTLILAARDDPDQRRALEAAGAEVHLVGASADAPGVDLERALGLLAGLEVNDVLVEAGPRVSGRMLDAQLADRLVVYLAPHLLGARAISMLELPAIAAMADRYELEREDLRVVGRDIRLILRPRGRMQREQ